MSRAIALLLISCIGGVPAFGAERFELRKRRSISVGKGPRSIAASPTGDEIFVVSIDAQTVSVIDALSERVVDILPAGQRGEVLACAEDGRRIYVGGADGVSVIDRSSRAVRLIRTPLIKHLAVAPNGRYLFLAAPSDGLWALDISTWMARRIDRTRAPWWVALTPDGRWVYVSYRNGGPGGGFGHDALGRFDASTGTLAGAITGLAQVGSVITISPNGKRLWADGLDACHSRRYDHKGCPMVPAGIVHVLNVDTDRLVHQIPLPGPWQAYDLDFSPDGSQLMITGNSLLLVDSEDYRVLARVPEAAGVQTVWGRDGRTIYTTCYPDDQVAVYELARRRQ